MYQSTNDETSYLSTQYYDAWGWSMFYLVMAGTKPKYGGKET